MKQTFQILFLVALCVCYSNKNFGHTSPTVPLDVVEHFVGDENPELSDYSTTYLPVSDTLSTPVISLTGSNCEGSPIILSVPTYEGTDVSYKWEYYGAPIENNHPRLFFQELELADAGLYRVTVEVGTCSATSEDYSLVVFTSPSSEIAPIDPSDVNCPDENSDLVLDATISGGTGVYTYEWTGPNGYISTEEDAVINDINPDKSGFYSIVTTDSRGCTHEPVMVEVNVQKMPATPTISTSGGTCVGETFELQAGNASTTQSFTWTKDGVVLDNTTNRLTIENLTTNDSGSYRVSVGGEGCEAVSAPFVLTITELPTVEVPNYPKFECTDGNSELTLSATGRGGSGGYQYVWSGPNDFFEMIRRPVLSSLSAEDAGTYEVFVEDSNGCVSEVETVELEVTDAVELPLLMTSGPACMGRSVTFSVAEYTGNNVSYNWIKNGQMLPVTTRNFQLTELDESDIGDYQVRVTVDGCSAVSPKYLLEIFEPPVATLNDMSEEMRCATGTESYTFDLQVTGGTPPYIYRWSGPNNFRSTLQNPTLSDLNATRSGVYSVVVRDQNGCSATSVSTRLTIRNAPAKPTITANGNFCEGGNITLRTPTYTGSSVSYQWLRNGTSLNNVGNVLSLNNATQENSGDYQLIVTVDGCSTTSDAYTLAVNENPSANITTPPSFNCTDNSESHTFAATVSGGTEDYTYNWQGPNGFTSALANPTINNLSEANAGIYTLIVRDGNRCNSSTATTELIVNEGVAQATITANDPVCAGENVVLSIPAYNESGVSYEWFFNGDPIDNNNSPQLIIENSTTNDIGDYVAVATFNSCETPTEPYRLTVNARPTVNIAEQDVLNCIEEDSELRFDATVTGNNGIYAYAWTGPDNFSSTEEDPVLTNLTTDNAGTYSLIVTDVNGCMSDVANTEVAIAQALPEPIIRLTGKVCTGENIRLSVQDYPESNITYVWTKDGVNLENNSNELLINNLEGADVADYVVTVNRNECDAISAPFTLTIQPQPNVNIEPVQDLTCTSGRQSIQINANVTGGDGNYTYEWIGPNGFRSSEEDPILDNVSEVNAGTYTLAVTDGSACNAVRSSVQLTITEAIDIPIITANGARCPGEQAVLRVQDYVGNNVNYTWSHNGNILPNTGNILTINSVRLTDAGNYFVTVTQNGCSEISDAYNLVVNNRPTVSIANVAPMNCTGGNNNVTLNSTAMGGDGDYTYNWSGPNNYQSTQDDPQIVNVTSRHSGTYQVIVTDGNGCQSNPQSVVVDITDAIDEPIIVAEGGLCVGSRMTLSVAQYSGTGIGYEWRRGGELLEARGNILTLDPMKESDSGNYSVRVTANGCFSTSEFYTLNVRPRPTASIENVAPMNCTSGNNNLTLNSNVQGDEEDYTYAWTGPNNFQSGQADPQIVNVTGEESGTYQLIVTDINGCKSNPTSVVVDITDGINEPIIVASGSTCEGQNLMLSVPEYNGTGIGYEWRRGGDLLEARGNIVTIDPLANDDSGNYSVRVTANGCSATSELYTLNVKPRPTVGIEDVQSMNCTGGDTDITLSPIVAGGTGEYIYSWTGPNEFQSTQTNPTIVNATSDQSGIYQLVVTDANGCNSAMESVTVDITEGISQPIITASSNVCEGESLTLSVPQYAGTGISYEWFHNGNLLEASGNELVIAPVLNTSNGNYVVNVKANGCDAVSEAYVLNARPRPSVVIDNVPAMNCATGINNMTLNSTVTGGSGNYTYSWTGPNGFASTQPDPQIVNLESSKAGTYQLVVTDVNACKSSTESVVVDITDAIPTPIINTSGAICDGGQIIIEVEAVQGSFVNYEWTTPEGTMENIAGLNTNRIIISPVDASIHEGNYRVVVQANGCQSRSEIFTLSTLTQPTANPRTANGLVCNGEALELFANAEAEGNATYRWEGPNGFISTLPNPVINNATEQNNGEYMLQVSNGSGCTTTEMLTVNRVKAALARPFITTNSPICMGEELQLSANTVANNFEWISPLGEAASAEMESLNTISSSTSYMPESQAYMSGTWYVRALDAEGCRSALSEPIEISITETPEAIANKSDDVCPGEAVQLFANETLGANYEWRLAGGGAIISTQANPIIQNIRENTSFGLTVIQNGCSSREAIITVNAEDLPEAAPIASYRLNSDCAPSDLRLLSNTVPEEGWTYSWAGPNGFTSSVADPIIVNADSDNNGAYELTITTAAGCSATYVTNVISSIADEIAQPIIAGSGPACEGESITLTGPMYEAAELTYNWLYEGRRISGEGSNQLIVNELSEENAGSYRMIVEVNGCVLTSNSYEVSVKTQPSITPAYNLSSNCEGGTLELMANAENASSYEWTGPNGFTSTSFNSTIPNTSVANNGGYSITATAANGCTTTESILIEDIQKTPIQPTVLSASSICAGGDITLQVAENYGEASDFIWINSGGQVLGNENLITLSSNDPAAQGPYRVRVAENGCFSPFSAPHEVIVTPAPVAIITHDTGICLGSDVQVFASGVADASYEWRHAFSRELLSTEQNPTFFALEDDLPLQLKVKVAGCTEVAEATTRLEVSQAPTILRIVGNNEVCENSRVTLSTSLSNGGGQDITYDWTGPNGFTYTATEVSSTPASLVLANVTSNMSGSYTVTATAANGCVSNTESILVEVSPVPSVPTISAIKTALCQGNELQLNATPYSGSNVLYEWMFNDGTFPVTLNITSEPTLFLPNVSPDNSGNYSVRILSADCDSGTSNSVAINVSGMIETPEALNSSSFDSPACVGETVTLTLPFIENATYQWYGPNGFTSTLPNPVIDAVSANSAGDYFAVLSLNDCATIVSGTTTVYINPTPTAPTITSNAPIGAGVCFGDNITLRVSSTLELLPNDVVSFDWYNASTDELLGTTESSTFELENVTRSGDYYVVMTLNNCATARSTFTTVEIVGVPDNVSAFAGQDQSICATTEATLFAIDNAPGMGLWTSLGEATILNPTEATADVIGLIEGENQFVWALSTGSCGVFSVDTVSINVGMTPVDFAMAGIDINVCGGNETTLNANIPTEANGRWTQPNTQINEGVTIDDPNDPLTTVTGLKEGNTYRFTWSLSIDECLNYQSDEVIVNVSTKPLSVAFIEDDEVFACTDENVILQANTPQAATGVWTTDSGATIIEAGSPKSLVTDLPNGASTFIWTLSNEACTNYSSDTLTVYSEGIPIPEPDFYSVMFNEAIEEVDLLENDDLGGVQGYEITITNYPDHGDLEELGDGFISYTPFNNFAGEDSLVYRLCNINCAMMCDTAVVKFSISGVDFANDCFIPNILTPNGDGMNDALMISCASQFPDNILKVFNRWGDLVYETEGYNNTWKATYKDQPLPAGTYFFLFKRDPRSEFYEQGYLTIFR